MTKQKRRISMKEYAELITAKVQEVMEQDRFKQFLLSPDMLHAFRQEVLELEPYSFNNRLTLALFGARAVAGYRTWQKLGYQVRKGSKGIPIYRPLIVKKEEEAHDEAEAGEETRLLGFDVAYVFDISQVRAIEDLDDASGQAKVQAFLKKRESARNFCLELDGGDEYLAGKLLEWASEQCPVEFRELLDGAKGFTNGKRIVIKQDMSPAQTMKTLLHELAHIRLGHMLSDLGRNAQEVQAESAAFVAAHGLGFDTGPYSFDYLASWGHDILEAEKGVVEFRETLEKAIEKGTTLAVEFQAWLTPQLPSEVVGYSEMAA